MPVETGSEEKEISKTISGNEENSLVLEYYMEDLNRKTPLDLTYNDVVGARINYYLSNRRRDIEAILSRCDYYFPIIETELDKYEIPLELKYVAVIESALNPVAKSRSGAVGLWQFLYSTCSLVDLEVTSYLDERRDVYKSTEAACRYFQYLYNTFHDWNLVMASYNGGPGEVRKAIERSGGETDYWKLRPYLSQQAADYVPSFIAMNYLLNYYDRHGIVKNKKTFPGFRTDTLHINYQINFDQITSVIDIPVNVLSQLNPVYFQNVVPKCDHSCTLVLPENKVSDFLQYENKILAAEPEKKDYNYLLAQAGETDNRIRTVHTVKRGEYIHKIALTYNCSVENIRVWNHLPDFSLVPGQEIIIWVPDQNSGQ